METRDMIDVMMHFDSGGEVEVARFGKDEWLPATVPCWNWTNFTYRIKPAPLKKVTLHAWLIDGQSKWVEDGIPVIGTARPVPSEDKEIEVEI